ncbi:hypothetical protein NP493_720g01039 [Ridgeia piscesae]|uniref:Uncharacterized protein n=1 Tax=Ridgeia piscesae TaxID=27915 RepID=A0AAD9NP51_RIDPI|nr:hypothetical protein NP493_720g01039 [Ridgeia piscesae]
MDMLLRQSQRKVPERGQLPQPPSLRFACLPWVPVETVRPTPHPLGYPLGERSSCRRDRLTFVCNLQSLWRLSSSSP